MSRNAADIQRCLFERDGSCRDINFTNPSWAGVDRLIERISRTHDIKEATDSSGSVVTVASGHTCDSLVPAPDGYVLFQGQAASALIRQLQVFVGREMDGMPFVEFTFFPDDLREAGFTVDGFVRFVRELQELLEATNYFVRYENASWRFGDCGQGSGVILSSTGS